MEPAHPCMTDTHCCLRHRRLSRLPLEALTRLILASRFRITALALHCLRLNPTSRPRLQGCVLTACQALSGSEFHQPILHTPNWRTLSVALSLRTAKSDSMIPLCFTLSMYIDADESVQFTATALFSFQRRRCHFTTTEVFNFAVVFRFIKGAKRSS